MQNIEKLLQQKNIFSFRDEGILLVQVSDSAAGLTLANELLLALVDSKTLLLLSGGRTPWALYETIASEEKLRPGAVGMIDERYGQKWHEASNEKKLQETGLLQYYQYTGIPVYLWLQEGLSREETATANDEQLRELLQTYQNAIGILGIGLDGHTAGIAGNRANFHNPLFNAERKHLLVSEFNDSTGMFKERVTMTFLGLAMLDLMIILVFGADKQEALESMFSVGPEQEIPARFYKRPEIAKKTLLITDQKV